MREWVDRLNQPLYDTEPIAWGSTVALFCRPLGLPRAAEVARVLGTTDTTKTAADTNMELPAEINPNTSFMIESVYAEPLGVDDAACAGIYLELRIGATEYLKMPWSRVRPVDIDHDGNGLRPFDQAAGASPYAGRAVQREGGCAIGATRRGGAGAALRRAVSHGQSTFDSPGGDVNPQTQWELIAEAERALEGGARAQLDTTYPLDRDLARNALTYSIACSLLVIARDTLRAPVSDAPRARDELRPGDPLPLCDFVFADRGGARCALTAGHTGPHFDHAVQSRPEGA